MAVLAELGLLEPVLTRGAPIDGLRCVNPRQRTVVDLRYRDLCVGWFGLGLHRGVLVETLSGAVHASSGITLKSGTRATRAAISTRTSWSWSATERGRSCATDRRS